MKYEGLRDWLSIIEQRGELTTLEDVDWNLEMGAVVDVLYREHPPYPPALIFDRIKDHKPGYRALFGHFPAATSSAKQCCRRRFRCCRNFTGTIRSRSSLWRRGGSEGPRNSGGKL